MDTAAQELALFLHFYGHFCHWEIEETLLNPESCLSHCGTAYPTPSGTSWTRRGHRLEATCDLSVSFKGSDAGSWTQHTIQILRSGGTFEKEDLVGDDS